MWSRHHRNHHRSVSAGPELTKESKMSELNGAAAPAADGKVLVWDAPVRVFHWLLVL